jgi:hypothetical protein
VEKSNPERHRSDPFVTSAATKVVHPVQSALEFVGHVSELDADKIRAAVNEWHQLMRTQSDAWFSAERSAGTGVLASKRTAEQRALLEKIAECVLQRVWYRNARGQLASTPEERVGSTEASGQYTATIAMLALLVRDYLDAREFELLYRPFAALIPLEQLASE